MQLVIDRRLWLRGQGADSSYLLDSETGQMCCLGFLCVAVGINENAIAGVRAPCCLVSTTELHPWLEFLTNGRYPSTISQNLTKANDAKSMTDMDREQTLRTDFKAHGINVKFIN